MNIELSKPIPDNDILLFVNWLTNDGEVPMREIQSEYKNECIEDSIETWCDRLGIDQEDEAKVARLTKEMKKRINAMIPVAYREYRKR